ncbi:hypothetical protein [uncultured Kiloniella sp.]|uniref:hypothetical protein n=1 Tax=uncultured Kiloniella sp. TaxID=1133091 RepID=UPI002636E30E|nr:hypothetical protein [uncultured Kiloniella sp.]
MAFLTEKMVYVIPMLAATSFFAAATDLSSSKPLRRLDQEEAIDQEGAVDVDTTDADGYTDNS